ncbi:MAG: aspartate 1-decarboxylase [Acidobacteriota bacterium]
MRRPFLRAKIHRATVTEACLDYTGSITIDRALMEAAGLAPFERVEVYNITSGQRFATYVIEGARGSGEICINGAAAHCADRGDSVIIAAYCDLEPDEVEGFIPRLVFVDARNRLATLAEVQKAATTLS